VLDRVLKRPLISAIAAVSVLVVLAIPVLHIHTADSGVDGLPRTIDVVQTYDRMQAAFPGEQFSADVVLQGENLDRGQIQAAAQELRQIARDSDQFNEPITIDASPDRKVAVIEVPLAGSGTDSTSLDALQTLRDDVVPQVFPSVAGGELVGVSGFTAGSQDFNELMASRIWLVFAFVFSVAFLLLLVTFRSIVIPIKAILLNVLSVGAAMGIVTYVFQDGHFEGLLNFDSTGAVSSWFPLMLFVILFGLSMDYHVFILSRIKEAVDRGESTDDAVSHGIKSTAGVVTAAAIVMVGVFGIFATLQFIDMKQFGVGLATAVLIDATLVRGVLLPATMKLLGKWNWYLPKWLEWMPKGPALEGSPEPHEPEARERLPVRPDPRPAEA
jgi:RND superfamily putative drug exporter